MTDATLNLLRGDTPTQVRLLAAAPTISLWLELPSAPSQDALPAPSGSQTSNAATVRATNGHTKVQIYVGKDFARVAPHLCVHRFQFSDEHASGVRETCVRCQSADERTIAAGKK